MTVMRRPRAAGRRAGSHALISAAILAMPLATFGPLAHAQTTGSSSAPAGAAQASKPAQNTPQRSHASQPAQRPAQGQPHPAHQAQARRGHVPPPTTPAQRAALPAADDTQKEAAGLVYYGKYVCDQKWEIHVERSVESPGYVDVRYQKDVWVMKPVASSTGAVRLEDMKQQTLLVQIPSKSMLLNTRTGQRLVDSCVGEGHLNAMKAAQIAATEAASTATATSNTATSTAGAAAATTATPGAISATERKPD